MENVRLGPLTMTCSVVSNDNLSALAKSALSSETSTATLAVPPIHPDEHSLHSVMRQSKVENASKEKNMHENASGNSQIMTSVEVRLRKKRKRKRQKKGHGAIQSNGNRFAVPKDAFSTKTFTAASVMPPIHPDKQSIDSVMRQSQVENASKEKNVHENASDKSQIMTSVEVSFRNKRKMKRQKKGHDAIESNDDLSPAPKDAFYTETFTAALAVPPTHPDEHPLDLVMRQGQVDNGSKEKNVPENSSEKYQGVTSAEVSFRKKRKRKRKKKVHDAIESNGNLSALPKYAFSTETSTAALAVPPRHPDEHFLNSVMRQSQVDNAPKEKNVHRKKRKKRWKKIWKKMQKKEDDAIESNGNISAVASNNNLSAVPKDAFSIETFSAALVVPPTRPNEHSLDSVMRQGQVDNASKVRNVSENSSEKSQIVTSAEVSLRKKRRRKMQKKGLDATKSNDNLSAVQVDVFLTETSTGALAVPPTHPDEHCPDSVLWQAQVENASKVKRVKNRGKRRRKKGCDARVNNNNLSAVRKDLTTAMVMPPTHPFQHFVDPLMRQFLAENEGKKNYMLQHVTDKNVHLFGVLKDHASLETCTPILDLLPLHSGQYSITSVSEPDHSKVSHFSLGRAISSCSKKKLLVLDLNGLLADFVYGAREGYEPYRMIHNKAVFKRPFCDDFLQFCFDKFHVGIWSSRTRKNLDDAINLLLGVSASKLLFAWDQSHCTCTKFKTIEDEHKPLMLKELGKLWEKARPSLRWKKGEFNETNTLLVDDSPYKAIRNPMHTAIFPYSYRYSDTDDISLGPGGDLRVYLEGLAMAENVQEYVASHPFGQPPITESSPYWNFYCLVRNQA